MVFLAAALTSPAAAAEPRQTAATHAATGEASAELGTFESRHSVTRRKRSNAGKGLSGDAGHVRRQMMPGDGGCGKMYKRYVAAGGHSAFAATASGWAIEFSICGMALNAGSKAQAEKRAMETCDRGRKKYKVETIGRCEVYASK
jgi:hypothetical protein